MVKAACASPGKTQPIVRIAATVFLLTHPTTSNEL